MKIEKYPINFNGHIRIISRRSLKIKGGYGYEKENV